MSWTGQKRGYHHGNLREALVEAAQALIAESGPAGFTIAEAARRAGVSPGAPYRHFRDAEALLAEVALRGFDRLSLALSQAVLTSPLHARNPPSMPRCSRPGSMPKRIRAC
jgi:AcrR family transcriptional regulator